MTCHCCLTLLRRTLGVISQHSCSHQPVAITSYASVSWIKKRFIFSVRKKRNIYQEKDINYVKSQRRRSKLEMLWYEPFAERVREAIGPDAGQVAGLLDVDVQLALAGRVTLLSADVLRSDVLHANVKVSLVGQHRHRTWVLQPTVDVVRWCWILNSVNTDFARTATSPHVR